MKELQFDSAVILSPFFWNFRDDMWQTTHHIAREFARLVPTLVVEPPAQWNPSSAEFRVHRVLRALGGSRTRSPQPGLTVFHRRTLPFGRFEVVRDFDLTRNARSLRDVLKKLGLRRSLLWHSFPYWSGPLLEAADHTALVYHCLDQSAREEEKELVQHADAVFCVSETLVEQHRALNSHTYLLPNGVDLTLFDACRASHGPRPADLPASGVVLGFLGYVNYHLDVELLVQVAEAFPAVCLAVVGRVPTSDTAPQGKQRQALEKLGSLPNVRILGFKPTHELPRYLQAFDVCLLPFLRNVFNQACDPLKFYQYLAMGKPIVATPVLVAERYRDVCYVSYSSEEFVANVARALEEGSSKALRQARLDLAKAHSWGSLVAQTCTRLDEILAAKSTQVSETVGRGL